MNIIFLEQKLQTTRDKIKKLDDEIKEEIRNEEELNSIIKTQKELTTKLNIFNDRLKENNNIKVIIEPVKRTSIKKKNGIEKYLQKRPVGRPRKIDILNQRFNSILK